MCTSLLYLDAQNRAYLGRTLELSLELPYQVAFFPRNLALTSTVANQAPLNWSMRYAALAVTMPEAPPAPNEPLTAQNSKIIEGVNEAGLTFSVQAYSQTNGPQPTLAPTQAALSAADLGTYVLGNFGSVEEVKQGLEQLPIVLESVAMLGGLAMPFHYAVHDATGKSLVIEFHLGVRTIYDNPVGVMTNAPQFSWHLTNLNNYTFLSNVDRSHARFMDYEAVQAGAGIAKAGLPASDTSVDRFVRAAYYAQFAEKQTDPDKAVQMIAHIMNNFDRPRGLCIDPPEQGSSHLQFVGHESEAIPTEFTTWTSLTDLDRRLFFLRDSKGMSYVRLDLMALVEQTDFRVLPMAQLMPSMPDSTAQFIRPLS